MIDVARQEAVWNSPIVQKALQYATDAHGEIGQKRKYTGEDYIVHPIAVAKIVLRYVDDENAVAAALLHDVVEDTNRTQDDITRDFGETISSYVEMLTDISKPSDGNRKTRKAIDCAHTAKAIPVIKTVKLADVLHNAPSIIQHNRGFAYKWMGEKVDLIEVLGEGEPELYRKVQKLIDDFFPQKGL